MMDHKTHLLSASLLTLICATGQAAESTSQPLPALNALPGQTSISGLSSGAFMAAQFHVAYSSELIGAGIVAGGPWNCAASNAAAAPLANAVSTCMDPCKYSWFSWLSCSSSLYPDSDYLADLARATSDLGHIDKVENLQDDQVYIFSGQNDKTVVTGVVDSTERFYKTLGLKEDQIYYNSSVDAGHGFITTNPDTNRCSETESPYINDCDIPQARRILEHIYGPLEPGSETLSGELLKFNQQQFIEDSLTSMDENAYVYIPDSCRSSQCRVHIAVHGCRQGISVIGDTYIRETGYLEVADTNNIILLYPQVKKSTLEPMNPRGCWDFWGYSSNNLPPYLYYRKDAPQMKAIKKMIDRLISQAPG